VQFFGGGVGGGEKVDKLPKPFRVLANYDPCTVRVTPNNK